MMSAAGGCLIFCLLSVSALRIFVLHKSDCVFDCGSFHPNVEQYHLANKHNTAESRHISWFDSSFRAAVIWQLPSSERRHTVRTIFAHICAKLEQFNATQFGANKDSRMHKKWAWNTRRWSGTVCIYMSYLCALFFFCSPRHANGPPPIFIVGGQPERETPRTRFGRARTVGKKTGEFIYVNNSCKVAQESHSKYGRSWNCENPSDIWYYRNCKGYDTMHSIIWMYTAVGCCSWTSEQYDRWHTIEHMSKNMHSLSMKTIPTQHNPVERCELKPNTKNAPDSEGFRMGFYFELDRIDVQKCEDIIYAQTVLSVR